MSEEEEPYCRLCAEPTPKTQIITPEDDVAVNSKVTIKMQWINIDISSSNTLPNSICYSCFDLLERTWSFLHNVRNAQEKLTAIFNKKNDETTEDVEVKINDPGKPVNENWEAFQNFKTEVKIENSENFTTVDPKTLLDIDLEAVKNEPDSYDDINGTDDFPSTDSDMPLLETKKRKKHKKKRKREEVLNEDTKRDIEVLPLDGSLCMTWEDYVWRCSNCDAQCKNVESLRLHSLQIHNCCCSFKCSDCYRVIPTYKTFINHVRLHKKFLRYCCEECNKSFSTSSFRKRHLNTVHKEYEHKTCQNCGSHFETQDQLQEHLQIFAKTIKKVKKVTTKQEKVEIDLKCEHCNKEFKSKSNLQQHKLVHTERSRDFSCHVCGKMFFTKGTLSTHMATHEDTKPFKCEFCPMAFRARGNLHSHASLHSGAKPFVCEQCGKSFRVKRHLKSHSIVHTDLMPYICEYCHKSFRFKTRLNLHLRQHTGAKPYNCVYCHRDFTNGSNFKKHMKRRHNIDTSKKRFNIIVDQNNCSISDAVVNTDVNSSS